MGWVICTWLAIAGRSSVAADPAEVPWSLRPIRPVTLPTVQVPQWARSPIDLLVLEQLDQHQLVPTAPADRRTLVRRVTLDLTGLPPTPEECADYLASDDPDALARVVDRLLASPRHGERWGRHWLDVVRYADARDLIQLPAESDFREAWRYRDWVIASVNADLPYDRFVTLQIAGDLLQPPAADQIDADALVATGLLAIADFVPGDVDKQQMIADYVNDQIDVVGRAFLGLTLACARCHDHKFDPITTEDYYALAGIFFSTRLVPGPVKGNTPLVRVPLISKADIAAIESEKVRDTVRKGELVRELAQAGQPEYREYIARQIASQSAAYLAATWEVLRQKPALAQQMAITLEVARSRGLDGVVLTRWLELLHADRTHPALAPLRSASDRDTAEREVQRLVADLARVAADEQQRQQQDPVRRMLVESLLVRLRADDRQVALDESGRVIRVPNRGAATAAAESVREVSGPSRERVETHGEPHAALRFSGQDLLQIPLPVPTTGSLFVVYRPNPAGVAGQRLIGWEDASAGRHGLGLMTDAAGALHAILRRNGTSGDVVVPPPSDPKARESWQIVAVTWGADGVAVFRGGKSVGTNKAIDSVSSDPAIVALRLGGPGSGVSPRFQGDVAELRVYDRPLDAATLARVEAELMADWCGPAAGREQRAGAAELYEELASGYGPFRVEGPDRTKVLPNDFRPRLEALRQELEALNKKPPRTIPQMVSVQDGGPADTPYAGIRDAPIYNRGNYKDPGRTVPRGFPRAIAPLERPAIGGESGRRELAAWLTHPANPLPARVAANRLWQHHFGAGIVRTSANLGAMGDAPSHPQLLDYLAAELMRSHWSAKSLHRSIVLSNVYAQASAANPAGLAADPENRRLWRMNRRRLEAEAIRDSLLSVAGELDPRAGGPGFAELKTPRRTVYMLASRTGAKTAEFAGLFDAAECTGIVERRNESIVAPQALFLLNDPLTAEWAAALGRRVQRDVPAGPAERRIERLYELLFGRPPTAAERNVGQQMLAAESQVDAWTSYCRVLICANEFLFVD